MKIHKVLIVVFAVLVIAGIGFYNTGYGEGYSEGKETGRLETEVLYKSKMHEIQTDAWLNSKYNDCDDCLTEDEFASMILEGIVETANSINVTFDYNTEGYYNGEIIIKFYNEDN